MASILAIVSRKIFERDFRVGGRLAGVGDVVPSTIYASTHKSLEKLAQGGDLFLVTVAPGEQLWLAGVLARPKLQPDGWVAKPNTIAITDITSLIPRLAFENGKGLSAKAGALAMSLQTPRTLAEADVELLRGAGGNGASGTAKASAAKVAPPAKASAAKAVPPAKAAKGPPPATAKQSPPAKAAPPATTTKQSPPAKAAKTSAAKLVVSRATASGSPLARVAAHLATGAYAATLDDLLAAWGKHKAAEIADLIDDLGAYIARALPAIETKKTAIDAAWRDVGDQLRPADVPRLLAAFEHGTSGQIEGWLDILDRFVLDPRMCSVAIETSTRFVASSAGPTRTRAFRLAEKIADGRCLEQIDKLLKKRSDAWNWKELLDRVRKMKTKFAPPPALPDEDRAIVDQLADAIDALADAPPPDEKALARTGAKRDDDGARLLAEVLADPASDAPRLVYADWLQQQTDPRGELIALQLQANRTPAQDERIAKLVGNKPNVTKWLGPLAAVVKEPVFARGFLDACAVELTTKKHREELLRDPLWATVTRVRCSERVVVETLPNLRAVSGLPFEDLLELSRRREPLGIECLDDVELDLVEERYERDQPISDARRVLWDELLRVGAFANVRELSVDVNWATVDRLGVKRKAWTWLLDSKLGKQLARLQLDFGETTPQITDWLPALRAPLETLVLRCSRHRYGTADTVLDSILRKDGKHLAITLSLARPFRDSAQPLRWEIQNLPPILFAELSAPELVVEVTTRATKAQLAALENHFATTFAKQFKRVTVRA